jgi:ankyrin repeat protein
MYKKEEWIYYIYKNNIEAIKYLLDNKLIDNNIQDIEGWTPLILAIFYNNIEIVKLLLRYKDINVNHQNDWKNTALIIASYNNNIEIVKLLLNHPGINIFLKDNADKTALDYVKQYNYKEIEILLNNISKPPFNIKNVIFNKKDWQNYIHENNIDAIKYLLDNNLIDINIQNIDGWTPLIYASYWNNIEILKLLLSYKDINVNHQNYWKDTALIWASYNNKIEIVKLLLNHPDINIFLKNKYGKTALDYAKENNNKEIIKLIKLIKKHKSNNFFNRVLSFFKSNNNDDNDENIIVREEKIKKDDIKNNIIIESKTYLNKLLFYKNKFVNSYLDDIYDNTLIIHDVIIEKDINPYNLKQFHVQYTSNFIVLFDKIIENYNEKLMFIDKKIEKCNIDINTNVNKINEYKKSLLMIEDKKILKLQYKNYIINNINQLFDAFFIKNRTQKYFIKDEKNIIGKISTFKDFEQINNPSYNPDIDITFSVYWEKFLTSVKNDVNVAKEFTNILNTNIQNKLIPLILDKDLLNECIVIETNPNYSIFKIDDIFFKINYENNTFYVIEHEMDFNNSENEEAIKNNINLLEIENNDIKQKIITYENEKQVISLDEDTNNLIKKYLNTIENYYNDIKISDNCNLEKKLLNKMLDVEPININN